ncbi:OsmC family protein [Flavobacteriaceae bacterium F89]|uniref:OsmC family protein n=1 Tax=Cerina litoralis TaxID=2874477 RepID=A0AAE3EU30_9FLAO|nr:OsmC family protein [Cerina litoralis]MCG2459791.1 OsmC family protein [Cerina litoralis]
MDSKELKSLQAPLKEKYRKSPDLAMITLRARGEIGENISCKIETGQALLEAGLHPATGGNGTLACSGDLLLESLVACAGVTLNSVATAIDFKLHRGTIKAEGDLDFRGTLGVSKEVGVGFKAICLTFHLDTPETKERIETLLKLTERYCVVYQTLCAGVPLKTTIKKA